MSKSAGNVVYADDLVNKYGVDAVRYYFLHEIPFAQDGVFTEDLLISRINSDLVNILGNLVNRTISMNKKYFDCVIKSPTKKESVDENLIKEVLNLSTKIDKKMDELKVGEALEEIIEVLRHCNKYIDDTTPWILAKDESNKERLGTVLYNLLESIRICAIHLSSFLPDTSKKILDNLNTKIRNYESIKTFGSLEEGIKTNEPEHLFARIENI